MPIVGIGQVARELGRENYSPVPLTVHARRASIRRFRYFHLAFGYETLNNEQGQG